MKWAIPIFIYNIPVSMNFFSPFTPCLLDKPLAVVSNQLDFENILIQRNWIITTFTQFTTLGLDLVLNNASYIKCKYIKCKYTSVLSL